MATTPAELVPSSWAAFLARLHGCLLSPPLLALLLSALFLVHVLRKIRKPTVYVLDYSCAKSCDEDKTNLEGLLYLLKRLGTVSDRDILFQSKVFLKSGIGEEAYCPRATLMKGHLFGMQDAYKETLVLIVGAVDLVLKKTGISPQEIDILVVNVGAFNPTPSLSALVVNSLKMRKDVRTFHLAGMGCSAGLIALALARDLLQVNCKSARYAVIASSEVLHELYVGKERSMMVTNCLFRSAGNALILSNRAEDEGRAKMQVMHVVRTNSARYDDAYHAVQMKEDDDGICGASLTPRIVEVAGDTFKANVETLAPKVLPYPELCKAGWNMAQKLVLGKKRVPPYVPNFKRVFEHFCIHPGGKAVIEGIGKGLNLDVNELEPSMMALHRFGNTSCCGVWYILAYMEAKKRLKKGDQVWQIGLGSGFKCTTAVLKMLRDDLHCDYDNPWFDCVDRYPVYEDVANQPHVASLLPYLPKWLNLPPRK